MKLKEKKYDSNRVLLRDDNNKIIYESIKGNFLNNDQFWKNKGGKLSYFKMQDDFNKFITEKGFNLDRGKVGSNNQHKTKLEYQVEETKAELNSLIKEKDNLTKDINYKKNTIIEINKNVEEDLKRTVNKLKDGIFNIGKALCKILKINKKYEVEDYNNLGNAINYDYYKQVKKNKNQDMER